MKKARKTSSDPYLASLDYRITPTQSLGTSPVQCLMSRRTMSLLPTTMELLSPKVVSGKDQGTSIEGKEELRSRDERFT